MGRLPSRATPCSVVDVLETFTAIFLGARSFMLIGKMLRNDERGESKIVYEAMIFFEVMFLLKLADKGRRSFPEPERRSFNFTARFLASIILLYPCAHFGRDFLPWPIESLKWLLDVLKHVRNVGYLAAVVACSISTCSTHLRSICWAFPIAAGLLLLGHGVLTCATMPPMLSTEDRLELARILFYVIIHSFRLYLFFACVLTKSSLPTPMPPISILDVPHGCTENLPQKTSSRLSTYVVLSCAMALLSYQSNFVAFTNTGSVMAFNNGGAIAGVAAYANLLDPSRHLMAVRGTSAVLGAPSSHLLSISMMYRTAWNRTSTKARAADDPVPSMLHYGLTLSAFMLLGVGAIAMISNHCEKLSHEGRTAYPDVPIESSHSAEHRLGVNPSCDAPACNRYASCLSDVGGHLTLFDCPSNAIHAQAWAPGLADAEYTFDGEFPWCQHEHQQQPLSVAIVSSCDADSLRSSASDEDSVASMYAAGSPSTLQSAADTIADTIPGTVPFRGCPFDEWDAWHNGTAVDSMIAPASQTGNIYSKNVAEIGQIRVGDSADASCSSNADGPSRFPPVIHAVTSQVLLKVEEAEARSPLLCCDGPIPSESRVPQDPTQSSTYFCDCWRICRRIPGVKTQRIASSRDLPLRCSVDSAKDQSALLRFCVRMSSPVHTPAESRAVDLSVTLINPCGWKLSYSYNVLADSLQKPCKSKLAPRLSTVKKLLSKVTSSSPFTLYALSMEAGKGLWSESNSD